MSSESHASLRGDPAVGVTTKPERAADENPIRGLLTGQVTAVGFGIVGLVYLIGATDVAIKIDTHTLSIQPAFAYFSIEGILVRGLAVILQVSVLLYLGLTIYTGLYVADMQRAGAIPFWKAKWGSERFSRSWCRPA